MQHTDDFLSRLNGVRETANGWEARCPCRNDDENPSLSISEDKSNGNILVTCHRGAPCSTKEICEAVGVPVSSLFSPQRRMTKEKLELVKTYDYTDENGELLFQKLRYIDSNGKKTFRQRKPDGHGGWEYSLGDTPKVLYNLPTVLKAVADGFPIWVVEGEKDADTLTELGIIATTMPGGAGKWLDIHTQALAGAQVDVIADNDEPGIAHAKIVYEALAKAKCDVNVWRTPECKDVTEYLAKGGNLDTFVPVDVSSVTVGEDTPASAPPAVVDENDEFSDAKRKLEELLLRSDLTPAQIVAKAQGIAIVAAKEKPLDFGRLVDWSSFIKEGGDDTYDWVIDEILEKGERVIVVAAEGVGKTMLARQVAILSGCGINPFTYQRMKQVRTLSVDLENPERIIRRTSTAILNAAMARGYTKEPSAKLLIKPSGLDLMKQEDRYVLESAIEEARPELIVMGPLYKAFIDPGGRTSEAVAVEIARYLDHVRDTYQCALWLEHHAPLGDNMSNRQMRPFGSAVWSRWPEFGLALTQDLTSGIPYCYDVRHFRGARDERPFPTKMVRGKLFPFEVIEYAKVSR